MTCTWAEKMSVSSDARHYEGGVIKANYGLLKILYKFGYNLI